MRRKVPLFVFVNSIIALFFSASFADDYATWSYSKTITLNTTSTGADVGNNVLQFPVLIRLNPGNFSSFSQTLAGGADIRFAKTDGTHLQYHIERWVDDGGGNDTAEIWVLLDTVYGDDATQSFVMYWGKAGAGDSSNSEAVFDAADGFMGIYHLGGNLTDATSNNNDGTDNSTVDTGSGIIGRARAFNGSSQYFHVGDLADRASGTVSCWFRPKVNHNSDTVTSRGIYGKFQSTQYDATLCLVGTNFNSSGGAGKLQTKLDYNYSSTYLAGTTNSFAAGTWYYVAWSWGNNTDSIYLNGILENSTPASKILGNTGNDEIGRSYFDESNVVGNGPGYFNGTLDEIRLDNTIRSADWIKLCYENQREDQTLIDMRTHYTWDNSTDGGIQTGSGTWGSDNYWTLSSGDGTSLVAWPGQGSSATFAGADGTYTITVNTTQTVDSIAFVNSGYTLSGGTAINFGTRNGMYVASGKSAVISTPITGSGGINLAGSGTLTLSGTNTYTGATTVSAGTLNLTGSTNSGSAVTVNSGATLSGTGTVNGTLTSSGTISPGTGGIGTLTVGGNVTLDGSATFSVTINGNSTPGTDYDEIEHTGSGTFTLGNAALSVTLGYTPSIGHTYTIINNSNASASNSGTFSGLAEGDTIILNYSSTNYNCGISYTGGTGNDVVLEILSERLPDNYATWNYSKMLSLNTTATGANVSGNVLDFPVLLRLNPGNFDYFSQTLDDGADIRFAKIDGTHLDYTIERWVDNASDIDTAEIWIKIDTVYGNSAAQAFVMYWGKAGAADSSSSAAVFDTANGFVGVWHLDEDPSGGGGAMKDVTTNGLNGTSSGTMLTEDRVDAVINRGTDFEGTDDGIVVTDAAALDITAAITVSAWFKTDVLATWQRIAVKSHTVDDLPHNMYGLSIDNTTCIRAAITDGGTNYSVTGTTTLTTSDYYYGVLTYDGSYVRLYV
ncbi:MAG: DUF2341 domain-containing protein, partial [Chitinispirillaceae bacterium]|nr:DUF2341 domain-containing protein [Chitinispirillaceae bacterium]